ncbi:hypothetical protein SRS16CHR_00736 [Variovorax sp. SRS16]|uniref:hypothetical protein n=1 Tax=Variovorax sp. SRS16 TaxID=282217 RepID=UPI0013190F9C|nr:hypothetical protein [Variovorax sp. SRS16]VTU13729.1 hypothetical protein SRS16CHR_00736 [Variovorax sp. SRS16]
MKSSEKLLIAAVAVSALLVVALAWLVPLYSDEVAMQMVRSRFFVEGGRLLNLLPQCRDLALPIPASWYPGAAVNALLYGGASELGLRFRGIALCLVWLSILWIWAGCNPQEFLPRRSFQAFVLGLNLLGVLPLVLILARSEQLMVIALTFYCLMPLYLAITRQDRLSTRWMKAVLFAIVSSVFLLAHPKALFFAPVMLVSCALVFRRGGWQWMAMLPLTVYMILQTFQHAKSIGQCTNAPLVSQMLVQQTLDFRLLFAQPMMFFESAVRNLAMAPGAVLDRVPVTMNFQSNWLPPIDSFRFETLLLVFGTILKASLAAGIASLVIFVLVRAVIDLRRRSLGPASLLALSLLLSLVAHASIYSVSIWHFYTPGLILPAFILMLMLAVRGTEAVAPRVKRGASLVAFYAATLTFVSAVILFALVAPKLFALARADDFVISEQPLSTPVFLSDDRRSQMQTLAAQCSIRDGDSRLVVDGSSYFAFQHGRQPINVLYVSSYAFGADIGRALPAFLRKIDSAGVISHCEYLPPGLIKKATVAGTMCCVSKAQLLQD